MAPRKHTNFKSRPKYIWQDSPFLSLPREIRDLIYFHALTKPTPIDLWPGKLVSEEIIKANPALVARQKKQETLPQTQSPRIPRTPRTVSFRHQYDLEFVRKELAVGLLSTCTQVYDEAWRHWWSNNTFRFSCDPYWDGIRRFLTTIGPRARMQLRHLQLLGATPQSLRSSLGHQEASDSYSRHKNHPKMRWAKIMGKTSENENFVGELLKSDGVSMALRELQYVVPKGFIVVLSEQSIPSFLLIDMLPWLRHVILVEDGAKLETGWFWNETAFMVNQTNCLDLICKPGSFIATDDLLLTETASFSSMNSEDSPLFAGSTSFGLSDIFTEPAEAEPIESKVALGGRAKRLPTKATSRVLKGFGGCRFERRRIWRFCNWNIAADSIPGLWLERPDSILEVVYVTMKKPKRAHKMGIIQEPSRTFDNYFPWVW